MPFAQHAIGDFVAHALSDKLHTDVSVGSVRIGLLNRVIIDDIDIKDQNGKNLLKVSRATANIELLPLFDGQIVVNTSQIFGLTARLQKPTKDAPANYQFIVDALQSDDQEPSTPIDLRIKSFILRRANISWDIEDETLNDDKFDINHLDFKNINVTLSVKHLTPDTLNLVLRRFNAEEANSSLTLTDMRLKVEASKQQALVTGVSILMPRSELNTDSLLLTFDKQGDKLKVNYSAQIDNTFITPSDLAPLIPALRTLDNTYNVQATAKGNETNVEKFQLKLFTEDNNITLQTQGSLAGIGTDNLYAEIPEFHFEAKRDNINELISTLELDPGISEKVKALGDVDIDASMNKAGDEIECQAIIATSVGNMEVSAFADMGDNILLKSTSLTASDLDLQELLDNEDFGKASFDLSLQGDYDTRSKSIGNMEAEAKVTRLTYKGYEYNDISLKGNKNGDIYTVDLTSNDNNAQLTLQGHYDRSNLEQQKAVGTIQLTNLNPYALHLDSENPITTYAMRLRVNTSGKDFNSMTGTIGIDSLHVHKGEQTYQLHHIALNIIPDEDNKKNIYVGSDFLNGGIYGAINYTDIVASIHNQMHDKMPSFFSKKHPTKNNFTFKFDLMYNDFLNSIVELPIETRKPVHLSGYVNDLDNTMQINIDTHRFIYDDSRYDSLKVALNNDIGLLYCDVHFRRRQETATSDVQISGVVNNNQLENTLYWTDVNHPDRNGVINTLTTFADSLGKLKTTIAFKESTLTYNDKKWTIHPSSVNIFGKEFHVNNIYVNSGDQYLKARGKISKSPTDTLFVDLKDVDVNYVTNLVDFHSVEFDGLASGQAVISRVYDDTPDIDAFLRVKDLSLQTGVLGFAEIHAQWDKEVNGIGLKGHIVDHGGENVTDVDGFVSPGDNKIDLMINLDKTNIGCLNGFIGSIFRNISGTASGYINVVGPLNDIGLIGDVSPHATLTLRATGVTYHTLGDTLRLRPYNFLFQDMRLTDNRNNMAVINGNVGHGNLKNFSYTFDMNFNQLCCYEEHEFNSDKFYGTVYADGNLHLAGSDGHPLNITANVSPTRGSVFAYDAASPDALTNTSFITYRDRALLQSTIDKDFFYKKNHDSESEGTDDDDDDFIADNQEDMPEYTGDIFITFNVNINPNCEIKLRMDNTPQDDAYMTTYGIGNITCQYYNKGPFTMFGNYDIQGGKYRMYLHDIIFRDLELQDGSRVAFNGNPFDANIHLLCHHTLPAVPLSDLAVTGGNQNNKVKVVCILDITGKLGNMNFNFDLSLPNVSEETRQLVRSMISTEEEMNTQLIYLLGLGRFYSSEYARATNNSTSSGAMSSLLSSTLSGQINQMLSNVIGTNSNWNFGTSLSTGERGWGDMDVEGVLSGRLLDDRLLINGNFGYRENSMKRNASFVGDFDLRWRLRENGNTFLKVYNQTNDRYFTKATLTTQGIGITYQKDFEHFSDLLKRQRRKEAWEKAKE
ncbi:MAG: translocation/assembly module TamB domain-containing protein [Bacteroidaceae bacterium]|nr:translocation/assembly module TamB domain-containing protein [Bacteroidaceae bacterium]